MKTIPLIFLLWKSDFGTFWQLCATFCQAKYNHFLWVLCFWAKNLTNFVHILENSTTHFTIMKKKRSPLLAPEKMKAKKTNLKTIWKLMIMQHSLMKRRPDWGTVFEYLLIVCWFSSMKHVHDRELKWGYILLNSLCFRGHALITNST